MSHEIILPIDRTLSTKGGEWHDLATHVETINEQVLRNNGLFFPIRQGTVLNAVKDSEKSFSAMLAEIRESIRAGETANALASLDDIGLAEIETHKNIIADFRNENRPELHVPEHGNGLVPLHVSRQTYEVISNEKVFQTVTKAFGGCPITSAGTLSAGQVFFMSMDIENPERVGPRGDKFMMHLNSLTSHNGTIGTRFFDSSVRVVCMNTVKASLSNRGILDFTVYHTKNAETALDKVSADMELIISERNAFFESLGILDTISCDVATARALYVAYTLQLAEQAANEAVNPANDDISTQVYNRAEEIGSLFVRGKGNAGANLYDAWNALTDCFSNGIGAGKTATKDKKFMAGMFGTASDIKEGYLPFLLQPSDVIAGLVERGNRALNAYAARKA